MRENRPYGSEGGASQTNGTSLPPIVDEFAAKTKTKPRVRQLTPAESSEKNGTPPLQIGPNRMETENTSNTVPVFILLSSRYRLGGNAGIAVLTRGR